MKRERAKRDNRGSIQLLDKGLLRLESARGDLAVPYRLTRSRRARAVRLTINRQNEVVLTLPVGCSLERGMAFMREKADWLSRHLAQIGPSETLREFLESHGTLSLDGRAVRIDWRRPTGDPFLRYSRESGTLILAFDEARHEEAQLKSLLRQLAAEALSARSLELAARHRLPVNRVSVRDQNSRWGSCSAKRNLSLNWRLLLLPPELHDYVIWHELAHLIEMNHSSRFWAALERFDPKARPHDTLLSRIGNRIMALGRSDR